MQQTRKFQIAIASLFVLSAAACIGAPDAAHDAASSLGSEDLAHDDKALGFGVEADAPDALAVLKVASTYSVAKLEAAGLTNRVAKNIYAEQQENGPFVSLVALDKVPYVGSNVFSALRWHATLNGHYPTSLRIPAVTAEGEALASITATTSEHDDLTPIGPHVWINDDQPYESFIADWAQLFDELELAEEVETFMYGTISDLGTLAADADLAKPCWVGNPWHVADLLANETDSLMSDQYWIHAWRVGSKTYYGESDNDLHAQLADEPTWANYATTSNAVLIAFTDYADDYAFDVVPSCRNPK